MLEHRPFDFPIGLLIDATKSVLPLEKAQHGAVPSPAVIVAGGFLRDHVLDREIIDVDLYIDVRRIKEFKGSYEMFVDKALDYKLPSGERCFSASVPPHMHANADGSVSITFSVGNTGQTSTMTIPAQPAFFLHGLIQHQPTTFNYNSTNSPQNPVNTGHISDSGIVCVVNKQVSSSTSILTKLGLNLTWNVQFIFICKDPIEYVTNDFCCDLSKIYHQGYKTVMLPEFVESVMSKQNNFYKFPHASQDRFDHYKQKIENKFPDFKHNVHVVAE